MPHYGGRMPRTRPEFALLDAPERAELRPVLRSWNGIEPAAVLVDGERWVVKTAPEDRQCRELLAHAIGDGIVNVADTRMATRDDLRPLVALGAVSPLARPGTVLLRRFAPDHDADLLPLRTLDEAVAGELAFSVLLRRRDAHAWNRSYTADGIPVFYDLEACLDFEPDLVDLDAFFARNGLGYAGAWRLAPGARPDTLEGRAIDRDWTLPVVDPDGVRDAVDRIAHALRARLDGDLPRLLRRSGYRGAAARDLRRMLTGLAVEMPSALERMWEVVTTRSPAPFRPD